jgi:tetratricopeptide (TPR) repeat protein
VFAPLADLYRRLGKLEEAETVCREGISRHPYYAGGRVAYAHILLDKSEWSEALTEIEAVVNFYPDNLLARKILIRVLCALGQLQRAQKEWEALRALAPDVANDPLLEAALQGRSSLSLKDSKILEQLKKEKLILETLIDQF